MLSGCHRPVWHGVSSRHAGAGALKFGCKVVLFPFSVSSLPSQQWHVRPRGEQPWSKRGWCRPGLCQGGPSVPVRAQDSSPSDVSVSSSSGRSLPIQMQCLVQATLSPAGCALPLAMADLTLCWSWRGWSGYLVWVGACPGLVKRNFPDPWVVSVFSLHLVPRS